MAMKPPPTRRNVKLSRRTPGLSAPAWSFVRLMGVALLTSQVERDETFARRAERMEALVAELRERTSQVASGGGEKSVDATAPVGSSRPAIGSTGSSIPAQRSSS